MFALLLLSCICIRRKVNQRLKCSKVKMVPKPLLRASQDEFNVFWENAPTMLQSLTCRLNHMQNLCGVVFILSFILH